jgi:hypothetical protein
LINVSGEPRSLQDHTGRWHVVPADGVFTVDDADDRYYQTGECGEPAIWAEAPTPTKTSKSKPEEA